MITLSLKLHIWCAVPCQPLPIRHLPLVTVLPSKQITRSKLFFGRVSCLSNHHLLSLFSYPNPSSFTYHIASFLLSQVFCWVTSLFTFKNFISPASMGFRPGITFPDANPYIWSYLSVITMYEKHINHWWMHWTVTKTVGTIFQVANAQGTFWKLHANLLLLDGLQISFWLWTPRSFQLRAGKKLSLNNDYTSPSHRSPKRKICHFTSAFTVAILTKCPYATSSEHWIYAYLHQMHEQEWSSFTATSLRTVFCSCSI